MTFYAGERILSAYLNGFALIENFTLAGTTASVTFSSVPPSERLMLFWRARNTASTSGDMEMQIDGATSNYQAAKVEGHGGSVGSPTVSTTYAPIGVTVGSTASYFSSGVTTIDGWGSSTGFTSYSAQSSAFDTTTSYWTQLINGMYLAAGPHSSIKLLPFSGSFAAGCSFTLYGLT